MRCSFVVVVLALCGCAEGPPSVPMVVGPTKARPDSSLQFSCWAISPAGRNISYQFDWGDGQQTDWGAWVRSGEEYTTLHVFTDSGVFEVTCRAKDEHKESDWSEGLAVRIGAFPPHVPRRPSGPDTVAVGDSVLFASSSVHPLAESLRLQFDWDGELSGWTGPVGSGEWVYVRHAYFAAGTFQIRARAKDGLEQTTAWSDAKAVLVVAGDED